MKIKNEKKALRMFCNESSFAERYRNPFINDMDNGRLVATDGYVMVLIDPKLIRCKYPHIEQRLPNLDYLRNDIGQTIRFADIEAAFNLFPLIPEKVTKDGKPCECPECDGTGRVEYMYEDTAWHEHYIDGECPICHGTGMRDDFELVETGRMLLPESCTFGLEDQIFDARLMMRVVEGLRLMGYDSMTWKSKQGFANTFSACDGITVAVMTVLDEEEHHQRIEIHKQQ